MASLWLLTDTEATESLRTAPLFEPYRVAPGAIRTFLPGVDPAWPTDAYRHRVLSFRRLADPTDNAWKTIGYQVTTLAAASPLPASVQAVTFPGAFDQALERGAQARELARKATADQNATDVGLQEDNKLLNELLDLAEAQIKDARQRIEIGDQRNAELTQKLKENVAELETAALDLHDALAEASSARAESKYLRSMLIKADRAQDAYPVLSDLEPPTSSEELLDRLDELPFVQFTGHRAATLELDDIDARKALIWAGKTWRALQSLNSYAEYSTSEQGFAGGYLDFCHTPLPEAIHTPLNKSYRLNRRP